MNDETSANGKAAAVAREKKSKTQPKTGGGQVRFDTSQLKSSYCNVCNATSTREEVVLNFGLNNNWDLGTQNVEVQLQHRIILSPQAAKRLQNLLDRLIVEHETRYGKLG